MIESKGNKKEKGASAGYGMLYLVATPIGNPADLSPRAREVLGAVDYIAAEDTRRAARLLSSLGIGNRLVSYHEHNRPYRDDRILRDLRAGKSIAVISDAGMPCISDPGEALVRLVLRHAIRVSVIPGPSALLTALAASGLDTARFAYEGFIPVKGKERKARLEAVANEARTIIFYEAPHRIKKTLTELAAEGLGARKAVVARELTKPYEEWLYFTLDEACRYYETVRPKGEFTLVIEGLDAYKARGGIGPGPAWTEDQLRELLGRALAEGLKTRDASARISRETGISRRRLYELALGLEEGPDTEG